MESYIPEWIVLHDDSIFLVACLMLLGCSFFLAKRLIEREKKKGRKYLLSYLVGSLLFLNLFFFMLVISEKETLALTLLPYLLQIIGLYGFLLVTYSFLKSMFRRLRGKKA